MPESLTLRLTVRDPLPGVALRVQKGRDERIDPVAETAGATIFEFSVEAQARADGSAALRGAVVQGPPSGRFVYVNAGTYAGDAASPWGRRAKVPLNGITAAMVRPSAVLAAAIDGRARDGGPAAATVTLLNDGWRPVV